MRIDTKALRRGDDGVNMILGTSKPVRAIIDSTADELDRLYAIEESHTPLTRERLETALKASGWEQDESDKDEWFEEEKAFTITLEDIGSDDVDCGFYADCGDVNINSITLSTITIHTLRAWGIINGKA